MQEILSEFLEFQICYSIYSFTVLLSQLLMVNKPLIVFQDYLSEVCFLTNCNKSNQKHIIITIVALIHTSLKEMDLFIKSQHPNKTQEVRKSYEEWKSYSSTLEKQVDYSTKCDILIVVD